MLTDEQVREAISQMKSHCRLLVEGYKAGTREYEMLSARGVLYTLGFDEAAADQVLEAIAKAGFDYCLDSKIACSSGVGGSSEKTRPSQDVCIWGVDQLESRLAFIR